MKIILVDDHHLVLDGFSRILKSQGYEVMAFTNPHLALKEILKSPPTIVLTDLDMPGLNGAELIEAVRKTNPEQKFILLTMHLNQQVIKRMMALKVNGFLSKASHPDELLEALEAILNGRNYYAAEVTKALAFQGDDLGSPVVGMETLSLSNREQEVLKLIAMGESTKLIASKLNISIGTVETHRGAIMRKLDVKNVAGMVRIAVKNGLV
jgi:DNA-binding NarL/FixJ family response regulator